MENNSNGFYLSDCFPDIKSKMTIGNTIIMNTKHFNWFHKIMWKILLGIKIEDYQDR